LLFLIFFKFSLKFFAFLKRAQKNLPIDIIALERREKNSTPHPDLLPQGEKVRYSLDYFPIFRHTLFMRR